MKEKAKEEKRKRKAQEKFREKCTKEGSSPFDKAGFFSKALFLWTIPFIQHANECKLEQDDNYPIRESESFETNYPLFKKIFESNKSSGRFKMITLRTLASQFKWEFILTTLLNILLLMKNYKNPLLVYFGTQLIVSGQVTPFRATMLSFVYTIIQMTFQIVSNHVGFNFTLISVKMKLVVSKEIYLKTLRVRSSSSSFNMGKITNLASSDISKLQWIMEFISTRLIKLPINFAIGLFTLYNLVGISTIAGLLAILVLSALGWYNGKKIEGLFKELKKKKDERVQLTESILSNIPFIKVYVMENFITKKLCQKRAEELKKLSEINFWRFLQAFVSRFVGPINFGVVLAIFAYVNGGALDPVMLFTFFSVLEQFVGGFIDFPRNFPAALDALGSLERIDKFLLSEELDTEYIQHSLEADNGENAIEMKNGNFYWEKTGKGNLKLAKSQEEGNKWSLNQQKPAEKEECSASHESKKATEETEEIGSSVYHLRELNMNIPKGKLIGVFGEVGSGKTSLFHSFVGDLKTYGDPTLEINGTIAYSGQKPWIQNGTIRSNVLFGLDYNEKRFKEALEFSCLAEDLSEMPKGDLTLIGDKGINLSGGQRARISFARCLYADKDIYLLDDPLSAVDVKVGKTMMKRALLDYLKGKTRILSTHAIHYAKYCDYIYVLRDGVVFSKGTYEELRNDHYFQCFVKIVKERERKNKEAALEHIKANENILESSSSDEELPSESEKTIKKTQVQEEVMKKSSKEKEEIKNAEGLLNEINDEDRSYGSIKLGVYWSYFKLSGGLPVLITVLILIVGFIGMELSFHQARNHLSTSKGPEDFWPAYSLLMLLCFGKEIVDFTKELLIKKSNESASWKIHAKIVRKLIHAPLIGFWDSVPIGRCISKLTTDLENIDFKMPKVLHWITQIIPSLFILVISSSWGTSYFIVVPLAIFCLFDFFLVKFEMNAALESRRMMSTTNSPVQSFFFESLNGVSVIRAFGQQEHMCGIYERLLKKNLQNRIAFDAVNFFGVMAKEIFSVIVQAPGIYLILINSSQSSPGVSGGSFMALLDLAEKFAWFIIGYSEVEKNMTHWERCHQLSQISIEKGYSHFEKEEERLVGEGIMDFDEPIQLRPKEETKGKIEFRNVSVKYRDDFPMILLDLSVSFEPGQKIGIIGRTGAGKSTLVSSIYRGVELTRGAIFIDGKNITEIDLKALRSEISVIPQSSYFFQDTLLNNIDPMGQNSKEKVEKLLEEIGILKRFQDKGGLDFIIASEGKNLAAGESQLIQLARALVKRSKVVIMDEATSSIDVITEKLIQEIVQKELKGSTVLIIAHRLHTIMNCDKVLVLEKGKVKEFDSPGKLMSSEGSLFKEIIEEVSKEENV